MITISRRALLAVITVVVLAVVLGVPSVRSALGDLNARLFDPRIIADADDLQEQRVLAEEGIRAGYVRAVTQLDTTRGLTLPITPAQAEAIYDRYVGQLRQVRREALAALADALGLRGADVDAYVRDAESRLDQDPSPVETNALVAPRLAAIFARADGLSRDLADAGTRELAGTVIPSPSPR